MRNFTSGTPWLPINENYVEINAQQATTIGSVYHYYRELVDLRQRSDYRDVIVYGAHQLLDAEDSEVYAYQRYNEQGCLLIIANFTGHTVTRSYAGKLVKRVLSNYDDETASLDNIELLPYHALVLEIQR